MRRVPRQVSVPLRAGYRCRGSQRGNFTLGGRVVARQIGRVPAIVPPCLRFERKRRCLVFQVKAETR